MTQDRSKRLPARHAAVLRCLSDHYCGVENAARRKVIRARFNELNGRKIGDRSFRRIISELVVIFKISICTTPSKGYFIASTVQEKNEALNYLDSVLTEVGDRRRALANSDPLERQGRLAL